MSGLTKSLLATGLTLPLVAFVLGVLVAPDEPEPDRSRPVIIGQVDDDGDDARGDDADERATGRGDRRRPPDRGDGRSDDERDDRRERPPVTVVTPAPRDLDADDDGVGDDDSDGEDETDDGGESDD
jgi:hypothetical protein